MKNRIKTVVLVAVAVLAGLPLQAHSQGGGAYGQGYSPGNRWSISKYDAEAFIKSESSVRDILAGQDIYNRNCGWCHSNPNTDAPQLGEAASWLNRTPELMPFMEDHVRRGFLGMPAKGSDWFISDYDLALAMNYIIKSRVPHRLPLLSDSLTQGRVVYHYNCAVCHDNGRDGAPRIGDTEAWKKRSPEWLPLLVDHAREGFLQMPRRGGARGLTEEDLRAAIVYMLSWSRVYP